MRKSNQEMFRKLLRENPDGLSITQLCKMTNSQQSSPVLRSLRCMPDAYIDRWELHSRHNRFSSVWCVVVPPKDCPKPTIVKG